MSEHDCPCRYAQIYYRRTHSNTTIPITNIEYRIEIYFYSIEYKHRK